VVAAEGLADARSTRDDIPGGIIAGLAAEPPPSA
jgi:hypothetical protein